MLNLIWVIGLNANALLQRYAPTNRILSWLRRRENLRYGVPAMLLAAPYLVAGWLIITVVEAGAPEWLRLIFLLLLWNAMKFIVFGPISLIKLARSKLRESRPALS